MTAVNVTGTSSGVFDVWLSTYHWANATITYSFPADGSTYSYLSTGDVTPISASQQAAVRQVLGEIASFTGLTFSEVTESAVTQGDLRFGADINTGGAYAWLPESHERGGDVFFGSGTDNPQIGNEAYLFFTHEIGHAMGLNHGHEYQSFKDSGFDSQEFTVVTYTDYVGDTDTFSYDSGVIDWAQSYMLLDIAAMQFLYGANYATTGEVWSGDTVYTFDPLTGEMTINGIGQGTPAGNRIFRTIWDGDGSDTYDLSNYGTDLDIDLAPGGWSTFSVDQLADLNRHSASTIYDARGNVANALLVDGDNRALIENAIGGVGNDTIFGNDAANNLRGKGGSDHMKGRSGDDTLLGNAGKDKLVGGNGADTIVGGNGKDKLTGGNGDDTLDGGDKDDRLYGDGGKDILLGEGGNDTLTGGKGMDIMTGGAGQDTFRFEFVTDSKKSGGSDIIKDFSCGEDTLDFEGLVAGVLTLSIDGAFTGTGASVITEQVGGDIWVNVDVDGDSSSDFRVILEGTPLVTTGDFIL